MSNDQQQQQSSDDYTIKESKSIRQLTPNQFYKVCPTEGAAGFGPPMCGDGTPFCFYVSRSRSNTAKLLVEIMGGGACWDEETCDYNSGRLAVPEQFNSFLGLSCSEIQVLGVEANGKPINMLCAGTLGDTDLSQYNSIIIPYCTQDVHVGNNAKDYAGDGNLIYHYGARNIQSVLKWIFKNFERPTNIALTGCSAGGTAVLPVYRAFHNQYNGGLNPRKTQINTIADSPVYLTPQYFLNNALDNWLPDEYFKHLGIPYKRYRSSENYSTLIWDFVLRKGNNNDRWAFVSHTDDPVSQIYYQWMAGYNNDDDAGGGRALEENDVADEWYQQLTSSVGTVQSKHSNLQSYWIDGEGHCSFGLYYALQESSGFEEFAGDIFRENRNIAMRQSAFNFFLSIVVAAGAVIFLLKRRRSSISKDGLLADDDALKMPGAWRQRTSALAASIEHSPYTAGYGISVIVYFAIMILNEGFVHPLDNPSLGPSANSLSAYGINNPSLIFRDFQWFRLISSNFLCSGVVSFLYVLTSLWWRIRHLEDEVASSFLAIAISVSLSINGIFCLFGEGASASSVGLMIGLRSYDLALSDRVPSRGWASARLIGEFALFALLMPFNSWILLLSGLLVGPVVYLAKKGLRIIFKSSQEGKVSLKPVARTIAVVAMIVFPLLILTVASPDPVYRDPFYTGCRPFWSDQIEDLTSGSIFSNDDDDNQRRRNLVDYDGMCAQFCVPNVVAPLVGPITKSIGVSAISKGWCAENGYETRSFTKTFSYLTYSLDIDVFYAESSDDAVN